VREPKCRLAPTAATLPHPAITGPLTFPSPSEVVPRDNRAIKLEITAAHAGSPDLNDYLPGARRCQITIESAWKNPMRNSAIRVATFAGLGAEPMILSLHGRKFPSRGDSDRHLLAHVPLSRQ
jgi:hypothetical protein